MPRRHRSISCAHSEPLEARTLLSRVIGYLPDYQYSAVVNKIDWGSVTHVNYFALLANANGSLGTTTSSGYAFSQLDAAVTLAHSHGDTISIVIDPGSAFTSLDSSTTAINNFVTNIKAFTQAHSLDGVDLDWEPGWGTGTVTQINNFGSLINAIKTGAPSLLLSAAVNPLKIPTDPNNATQAYLVPLSAVNSLDVIDVMGYDFQLPDHANYTQSINALAAWGNYAAQAGVPKSHLVLGVPFYAHDSVSWSDVRTYQQIVDTYAPAPSADSASGWYFNGPVTIQNKSQYVLNNGYGGIMFWQFNQDHFTGNLYDSTSLTPIIKSTIGLADFTTLDASHNLTISGDSNANTLSVSVTSTSVIATFGVTTRTYPLSMVSSITINGLAGDDTINFSGTPAVPVTFVGGGGNDTLNVNAGTLTLNSDVGASTTALSINIAAGAAVTFGASEHLAAVIVNGTASLAPNGAHLLVAQSLSLGAAATLELNDNDMLLSASGSPQLSTVQNAINLARAGGAWNGLGITSASAHDNALHSTTLGAMTGADYRSIYGTSAIFDGESVTEGAVVVRYTYYGDANFNGKVDGSDYARIDSTFNSEPAFGNIGGWLNGDFDGNGKVDGGDYGLIDASFNSQSTALRPVDAILPIKAPSKSNSLSRLR